MPTVQAIESALFALAPRELAMDWDNVGLLLGDPAAEVTYALLALDVTDAVAAEAKAKGCQLIVSHHPLMNVRWHQREMPCGRTAVWAVSSQHSSRMTLPSSPCIPTWMPPPAASTMPWLPPLVWRTLGLCPGTRAASAASAR